VMDDLVAKFLPRFAALARERIRHALETATDRRRESATSVAHDLHALAGEAGLLGLGEVIGMARRAEAAAKTFGSGGTESDAIELEDCLRSLERAVADATGAGAP
jgi:HPt (histidine-containing phosphotransfer) domain-containing protein